MSLEATIFTIIVDKGLGAIFQRISDGWKPKKEAKSNLRATMRALATSIGTVVAQPEVACRKLEKKSE